MTLTVQVLLQQSLQVYYIMYCTLLQLKVVRPAKEKKKLRKLRKETLKDEEKKLFPEVSLLSNM